MTTLKARPVIKESWELYKKFWKPLLGFIGINIVLNIINGLAGRDQTVLTFLLSIVILIASVILSFALMKFSIDAANHKSPTIRGSVEAISWSIFWRLVAGGLLVGIISIISLALLVVPFFIVAPRLALVTSYIVEGKGVRESFKESWAVTKGNKWFIWKVAILCVGVALLGMICLIVGLIPAMGVITLARGVMYIRFKNSAQHKEVVQSIEQN